VLIYQHLFPLHPLLQRHYWSVIRLWQSCNLDFVIGAQQPIGQRQPIYGSTYPMSPSVHNQNAVTHTTQHLLDASQLARRCQLGSGTHLRSSCRRFQWASQRNWPATIIGKLFRFMGLYFCCIFFEIVTLLDPAVGRTTNEVPDASRWSRPPSAIPGRPSTDHDRLKGLVPTNNSCFNLINNSVDGLVATCLFLYFSHRLRLCFCTFGMIYMNCDWCVSCALWLVLW